jgi:DNA-binding MarR family transcriptional regulator/N-acetylglutamate synthase-like GNAT family acetyltransferase
MGEGAFDRSIDAVRRFNRFYTRRIGVLHEGLLGSPLPLTHARVLYEVARRDQPTASALRRELGLNAGYLSRVLARLESGGLLGRRPSAKDGRQSLLRLMPRGKRVFARLDARSRQEVGAMLRALSEPDRRRLVETLGVVERLLGGDGPADGGADSYLLRPPEAGDMGWVVERHGILYAREYQYDQTFEALVARIVGSFVDHFEPRRERCWIAERRGAPVGSVFLVRKSARVAKLRLLLVEPEARGLGIGRRLVEECVRFARQAGYRKLTLWTQSELLPARALYRRAGFRLVGRQRHHSFGKDLVAETWDLAL